MTLSVTPTSKEDAELQKAMATHHENRAAKLNRKGWGTTAKDAENGPTPFTVNIIGNLPGMEHLSGAVKDITPAAAPIQQASPSVLLDDTEYGIDLAFEGLRR
jgi:hypothetical protein